MTISTASFHDYEYLIQRWQQLALTSGCRFEIFDASDGLPVWYFASGESESLPILYLSAGIHGDECAPVWALLEWAEQEWIQLSQQNLLIFPCLNPSGFIENRRTDGQGRDLNRCFHDSSIPLIGAWRRLVEGRRFSRTLCLHEDFDARGIYLYELCSPGLSGCGRALLESCSSLFPFDSRSVIEGVNFDCGRALHHPEEIESVIEQKLAGGFPEAILLFLEHSDLTLTFETPSEAGIDLRIATHLRAISTFIEGPKLEIQ